MNLQKLGVDGFGGESSNPFTGLNVAFELTNQGSGAEARLIAFSKGWYDAAADMRDAQGHTPDAVIADGTLISTINKEVTCAGKSCRVADVAGMLAKNACRLKGIKLAVDDAVQLDEEIQVVQLTAEGPKALKRIIPSSSKTEDQQDPKRVSIDLTDDLVVLGADVVVMANLAAGRKCTYTLFYEKVGSYRALVQNNAFGE